MLNPGNGKPKQDMSTKTVTGWRTAGVRVTRTETMEGLHRVLERLSVSVGPHGAVADTEDYHFPCCYALVMSLEQGSTQDNLDLCCVFPAPSPVSVPFSPCVCLLGGLCGGFLSTVRGENLGMFMTELKYNEWLNRRAQKIRKI